MEQQLSRLARSNDWWLELERKLGKKWAPFVVGVAIGAIGFGFAFGLYVLPVFVSK